MFLRPVSALTLVTLLAFTLAPQALAQIPASAPAQGEDIDLIVVLRTNGVDRGEVALRRTAGGDFWIAAQDLSRLKLDPVDAARRQVNGELYFSFAALGARSILYDENQLTLNVEFPARGLEQTRIDLSNRPPPIDVQTTRNSAILNYRAAVRQSGDDPMQLRMTGELGMRLGEVLLRQEAKYDTGTNAGAPVRGMSQLIWDDRVRGNRFVAGDVVVPGGSFGTTFTGGGVTFSKLYAITPDVIRHPGAALQVSTPSPADVEVTVDGNSVYRARVGPGPIALDNLYYTGGARTVRVTVTDASGRRQVIEQPFLFTDSVLAKGLHEFSYFAGKRSALDAEERWRYGDDAWQGFHRYGVSDSITVEAGAEGTRNFTSGGVGAVVRNDLLGLFALDLLGSADSIGSRHAAGWALRYSYTTPDTSFFMGHRQFEQGFRSLASTPENPALLEETRLSASTRVLSTATLSADLTRGRDLLGERSSAAVRLATNLGRRASLHTEVQASRIRSERDWGVNVYLRLDLDDQRWVNATFRSGPDTRGTDLEAGKQLPQGEGVGYRVGVTANRHAGEPSAFALGSVNWNLRPATLEFYGTSQLQGGRAHYAEAAVSGAVVGVDGFVGMTRQVGDGFAVARLGVAHPGVDIFLNNQLQGQTDAKGTLLIPNVGAYGRQDVSLDDKQIPMQYNIASKRVMIAPPYRSGTVVDFGGRKLRAAIGSAWAVRGQVRKPIASRTWTLASADTRLVIETAPAGDFYLEDAAPGRYSGTIEIDGAVLSCRVTVPDFPEAVHELQEGVICE